ncbi:MAG: hypothetical protein IPM23_18850 [Candidatus Melainabacteria bacterium]|nr:hypothetical protein [Candidatus Melainabacteria bacterium]
MVPSRRAFGLALLLSACLSLFALPVFAGSDFLKNGLLTDPTGKKHLVGAAIWSGGEIDAVIKPAFKARIKPGEITVGRNHPNGTRILACFKGVAVELPMKFFSGSAFDDFGDIKDGFIIDIAQHDFDADGSPEIVAAVGNGLDQLQVDVIKYHPPQKYADRGRSQNWTVLGSLSGQSRVELDGNKLRMPIGSRGRFEEYTLVGTGPEKKFVKSE